MLLRRWLLSRSILSSKVSSDPILPPGGHPLRFELLVLEPPTHDHLGQAPPRRVSTTPFCAVSQLRLIIQLPVALRPSAQTVVPHTHHSGGADSTTSSTATLVVYTANWSVLVLAPMCFFRMLIIPFTNSTSALGRRRCVTRMGKAERSLLPAKNP